VTLCCYCVNNSDSIKVWEYWPGVWKAKYKDTQDQWIQITRTFRTRLAAQAAAENALVQVRVP
jgi:hypothetical protein